MPVAYLTTKNMKAQILGERLEIALPPDAEGVFPDRRWIPLRDIEHVVVDSGVHLSMRSLCGLLSREIPVLLLSNRTFPHGVAMPFNRAVTVLADQIDRCRDATFRQKIASNLIQAKTLNQRRVLQRLASNRKQPPIAAQWLKSMSIQAAAAGSLDSLRGLEGAATGRYFETLALYFPSSMPFERRTRRPPRNEANSLLSFLYTLATHELVLHLRAIGLEPGWGFFHEAEDGRPALALDLLEPYRAPLVDALVLDMLNHNRFSADDFERDDNGGVFLKRLSRRKVYAAWEDRMEREFQHAQTGHRTCMRQHFKDTAASIKKACIQNDADIYQPFLMN